MLVLTRKKNEAICIDGQRIRVIVVEIRGDKVRLGIEAHPSIIIHREEVQQIIDKRDQAPEKTGE